MELSLSATDITSGTRHPPSLCHLLRGSIGLFFSETSPVTDRENTPFCRFVTMFRAIIQNVFSPFLLETPFFEASRIVHKINIGHFASVLLHPALDHYSSYQVDSILLDTFPTFSNHFLRRFSVSSDAIIEKRGLITSRYNEKWETLDKVSSTSFMKIFSADAKRNCLAKFVIWLFFEIPRLGTEKLKRFLPLFFTFSIASQSRTFATTNAHIYMYTCI